MTQHKNTSKNGHVKSLLSRMDHSVASSFSYKQRKALQKVLSTREWEDHYIDVRPTLALPFVPWSVYIVLLGGVNKRRLTTAEQYTGVVMFLLTIFIVGLLLLGGLFVMLYLVKSWLGIDIFPEQSLGLWDEISGWF